MLFIAECEIEQNIYMDKKSSWTKLHLVEADDEEAATKKISAHYDKKYDAYSVSYNVHVKDISEVIQ
jgi:hypothetical protein